MCGITGIIASNLVGQMHMIQLVKATETLERRGPDNQNFYTEDFVALGHRRLSIIDTGYESNQPMRNESGRYVIVYNGEVYNYKALRHDLETLGYHFNTQSDTEVVLNTYIHYGKDAFKKLNGFFSLAIYDREIQKLVLARDRYGIKPLYYYNDNDKFIFASELKALLAFNIPRELNYDSLPTYFQLNYFPDSITPLKNVYKLQAGEVLELDTESNIHKYKYYDLPNPNIVNQNISYNSAQVEIKQRLEQSVQDRLVSDVPLGTFLSGGIDSSIISTIASREVKKLNTFSIGYKDNPHYDETKYANLVAKKIQSEHTVFLLSNQDIFEHAESVLDYLDEPFADSSALPVYILSALTCKQVTVSLSGDGADELFSGYNKHMAEYRMLNPSYKEKIIKSFGGILNIIPQSRNSKIGNFSRQVNRFLEGVPLSAADRYWRWASIGTNTYTHSLLTTSYDDKLMKEIQHQYTGHIKGSINEVLYADMKLVLAGDMLPKVDRMSMANSLEVRVPFLDHHLVDYVSQLPEEYKITKGIKKRILQDTFRDILPSELYNRPKKGFEIPLTDYLREAIEQQEFKTLLEEDFLREQKIFNSDVVGGLVKQIKSSNVGDSPAKLWAIICFQWWHRKYMIN